MARLRGLLPLSQIREGRFGPYKYEALDRGNAGGSYEEKVKRKYRKQQQTSLSPWNRKSIVLLIMVLALAATAGLLISG